ncbi:MAG TPA: metal ABC transporter substrate-binding protein [Acidimicrobiia bacterium]|jgi:zinc/manganese transport system substrate-binding protein|nr:metal ABC transporter substrate-binding protein [Acidimicrobiia bacterium]
MITVLNSKVGLRPTRREVRRRTELLASIVLVAIIAAACGGTVEEDATASTEGNPGLRIVATTTILGDVVSNIVGTDGAVDVLMPRGADPHDFQASAAQIASVNRADLVIANGLGLEESLTDVLASAADDGVTVVELAPLLDPLPFGGSNGAQDSDDPHVWLDPLRMVEGVRLIGAELAAIQPAIDWSSAADAYATDLTAAHEAIVARLSAIPGERRRLVTNHDALGYFADRYGFLVVGTVIPAGSTLADPSSEALAELIEVMQREGVSVIFGETTQPDAIADAVAAELGQEAQVVELFTGSLGEAGSGADTLIGLLTTNADRIASALAG